MRAVPVACAKRRTASARAGSRRRLRVVVPAAISGIVAAMILGIAGRSARRWSSPSPPARSAGRSSRWNPLEPGQTMTGRHGRARHGSRPGDRQQRRVPEPVLPRPAAVRDHPRAQRRRRRLRAPRRGRRTRVPMRPSHPRPSPARAVQRTPRRRSGRRRRARLRRRSCWSACCSRWRSSLSSSATSCRRACPSCRARDRLPDLAPVVRPRPRPASPGPRRHGDPDGRRRRWSRFPLGILTAVYLEEYAPANALTRFIDINIRNLAGVPSIVYGLLGLAMFVALFAALGIGNGRNIIAGGLDARRAHPADRDHHVGRGPPRRPVSIREAGYGVGASRWQVTRQLVLPAARPGILTGTVLALARALGETAPLILAGAVLGSFSTGGSIGRALHRAVHRAADHRVRLGAQAAGGVPRADVGRDHRAARDHAHRQRDRHLPPQPLRAAMVTARDGARPADAARTAPEIPCLPRPATDARRVAPAHATEPPVARWSRPMRVDRTCRPRATTPAVDPRATLEPVIRLEDVTSTTGRSGP